MPDWTAPMLATLTDDHFSSEDWIYERKLDGERCLVFGDGRGVRILSRNRKKLNDTYPELVEALEEAGPDRFITDGEIVTFDGKVTSFSRLQQRIGISDPDEARATGIGVWLYLFDLIYLDRYLLDELPLRSRKRLLRDAFDFGGRLRYTRHRNTEGEAYYQEACRKGWEGVIAKKADGRYVHSRSRDWLKFKCVNRQELVIGGYTDPKGSRKGFGALLVGYYEDDELRYAGKVGTGFDDETLEKLHDRMQAIERDEPGFDEEVREKNAHWITPELVGEFGFTEWTGDGKLRHPRYIGLREDKPAKKVRRERPRDV
ncbi:non-homologous end-joining DNA ligase [Lentisalinibacter sediminis]|uniref:non-homologous end-joining DNA ligase n=1 Tax=Lentisalinibacter sediminis TaxID=2992237 RepID=UPI0038671AD0